MSQSLAFVSSGSVNKLNLYAGERSSGNQLLVSLRSEFSLKVKKDAKTPAEDVADVKG